MEETMAVLKPRIKTAIVLGLLSLLAGVFTHLALTDIYHREGDLTLEWNILRICALVFVVFTGYTLITLRRILKSL